MGCKNDCLYYSLIFTLLQEEGRVFKSVLCSCTRLVMIGILDAIVLDDLIHLSLLHTSIMNRIVSRGRSRSVIQTMIQHVLDAGSAINSGAERTVYSHRPTIKSLNRGNKYP